MYEFHWPTKTILEAGGIAKIAQYLPSPGRHGVLLLVAPREPWIEPLLKDISRHLQERGWGEVIVYPDVEPNPSWDTVLDGVKKARRAGAGVVLAVGGGSVMDAAKVIAERTPAKYLCTVPTTAGTGGEISPWAVISNLESREKESMIAKWPDLALLDPELTHSLPPKITLFTGIDAFIHGLEAYLSSEANAITDALALQGMNMVNENLAVAIEDGDHGPARQHMLEASLLTGAAMLHAGLGLMHAIGNVTGGLYHELPHGLVLMRSMDTVLEYNQPVAGEKYQAVATLVDDIRSLAQEQFVKLNVPDVVVKEEDLSLLAQRAAANVNARTNPRTASPEEIQLLVREAFTVR